ncbi:hypothetical protein EYC84_006049 [Monilinia fructicola]|uniref:Uncharacterized protein n=1 Tax=Monilinia fructicola TaxID=38448 RepID=A0A5M9K251_MONFR|nr:hypothetical protein EYC84_006049 [Monilinia fructicola]
MCAGCCEKNGDQKSGGSIVFIASISAHTVNYPQPQIAYNVSKSSLLHMKSCLRRMVTVWHSDQYNFTWIYGHHSQ